MEYVRSLQLKKGETIPLRRGLTWLRRREVWMCVRVKGHREEVKSLKRGNLSSQSVLCSQGCQFFDKICWKLNFFSKFSKLFQFVPNSSIIPWNFRFLKNPYIIPIFGSLFQLFQMWQPCCLMFYWNWRKEEDREEEEGRRWGRKEEYTQGGGHHRTGPTISNVHIYVYEVCMSVFVCICVCVAHILAEQRRSGEGREEVVKGGGGKGRK